LVTCHTLYVVFIDLAECCVFVKQSVDPFHCDPPSGGHPFFQSYGARLPSSLTRFHSHALVYSTHPPVSVYGTGNQRNGSKPFLGRAFSPNPLRHEASMSPCGTATFNRQLVSSSAQPGPILNWCRNINLLSIAYALRPRLRTRLTLGGRSLPRKPWVYGDRGSHPVYRYSCLHSHLFSLHPSLQKSFNAENNAPLPLRPGRTQSQPGASVYC
jgi:hypothetical protein